MNLTLKPSALYYFIITIWLAGLTAYAVFGVNSPEPVKYQPSKSYVEAPDLSDGSSDLDYSKEEPEPIKPSQSSCISYDGNYDNDTC